MSSDLETTTQTEPGHEPAARMTPEVKAWCMYDWANSAFSTLVITFIYSAYFAGSFAPDEATGTLLWSRGIVISSILIAILSPIFGTMADKGGARRQFLTIATLICVVATAALAFVHPGQSNAVFWALTIFVIANVAFEIAIVFYNAFLPDLVPTSRMGRVSGTAWGLGYLGGLVCLVLALLGLVGLPGVMDPWINFGGDSDFNIRATNLLVAGWFLLFSIPTLLWVKDRNPGKARISLSGVGRELVSTVRHLREYRETVKFLGARLIYNDGLVTVFGFGSIYAMGTFGMTFGEVIILGIVLNVAAGLGAWLFGFVDDRVGGRKTILITLVALSAATIIAVWAPNKTWFWVAGIGIGLFVGPNQSASRSLMGRFVPTRHSGEFFGFFAFSGKATAFMGPWLLGELSGAFGNQRIGVGSTLLFFIVGAAIMLTVNEKAGIAAADATDAAEALKAGTG